jgi:hemoglobin/transferrin/lactoferrin receptor protein
MTGALDQTRFRNLRASCDDIGLLKLCILLVAAAAAGVAAADEQARKTVGSYDLEEIVVTASRREQSAFEMPYSVILQDMLRLQEQRQVRTIPEAMAEIPAVMVQKTGHGQGSPYIRGFTGLRTLFLIDGIRLNNSTFREGPNQYWNTVDPYSVDRLELVMGPSSVLYGSDAIGGTVNAISRSLVGDDGVDGLSSRLVLRGSSAEDSYVIRPEFTYKGASARFYGGVSLKRFGDLTAGGPTGEQPMTGYDEADGDIKLSIDLAEGRELVAAFQHVSQDDAWRVHKTVFGKSWRGTTTGNELRRSLDQERTLAYLQYRAKNLASHDGELVLSLSYHAQDESRVRTRNDGRTDIQGTDVGTIGAWAQYSVAAGIGTWTVGAEVYRDEVDSFRDNYNSDGSYQGSSIQGPVADDAEYLITGLFVQNQVTIGRRTDLVTGVRFMRSSADANRVEDPLTGLPTSVSGHWDDVTGSIRVSHALNPDDADRIFAGISQGFRAPNLSDLTRFDSARSNEIETPVADLDAEQFVTYEIGWKTVRDRLDAQLSAYYTTIRDLIMRTPTGRVIDGANEITKRNSASGEVKGLEIQARYRVTDSWDVYGNLTWMDGSVDTYPTSDATLVREPKDRLMPATAYLGVFWSPDNADYWAEALVGVADRQEKLSTRDQADTDRIPMGGTPGFTTVTLRGGWRVSERLGLSVSLSNVFDEDYRIHGSGLNEPGRNITVSVFWSP